MSFSRNPHISTKNRDEKYFSLRRISLHLLGTASLRVIVPSFFCTVDSNKLQLCVGNICQMVSAIFIPSKWWAKPRQLTKMISVQSDGAYTLFSLVFMSTSLTRRRSFACQEIFERKITWLRMSARKVISVHANQNIPELQLETCFEEKLD